jgi:hypothetical protein
VASLVLTKASTFVNKTKPLLCLHTASRSIEIDIKEKGMTNTQEFLANQRTQLLRELQRTRSTSGAVSPASLQIKELDERIAQLVGWDAVKRRKVDTFVT